MIVNILLDQPEPIHFIVGSSTVEYPIGHLDPLSRASFSLLVA
jgi:hypothetical protein